MANDKRRLGEILIGRRLITKDQLETAFARQRENHAPLGTILIEMGLITEDLLLQALAAQYGVSAWHLDRDEPKRDAFRKIPEQMCRNYQVLPVQIRGDLMMLAMRNPMDLDAIDAVRNVSGMRIEPVLANEDRLSKYIEQSFSSHVQSKSTDGFVCQGNGGSLHRAAAGIAEKALTEEDTRPIIGLVNQIISDAIRVGSSDIHIEPRADRVDIRYRLDGQLQKLREIPIGNHADVYDAPEDHG